MLCACNAAFNLTASHANFVDQIPVVGNERML